VAAAEAPCEHDIGIMISRRWSARRRSARHEPVHTTRKGLTRVAGRHGSTKVQLLKRRDGSTTRPASYDEGRSGTTRSTGHSGRKARRSETVFAGEGLRALGPGAWRGHGEAQASTIKADEVHNRYAGIRGQGPVRKRWCGEHSSTSTTSVSSKPARSCRRTRTAAAAGAAVRSALQMTSGHNRWSIHSMNMTNRHLLNTHRGEPFVFINDSERGESGDCNGEQVQGGERTSAETLDPARS